MSEVCRQYRNTGKCRYKEACRYEHSEGPPIEKEIKPRGLCHLFGDTGECKYGDKCRYFHGTEAEAQAEADQRLAEKKQREANGEPEPQGKKKKRKRKNKKLEDNQCLNWTQKGECEYADKCRYLHGPDDNRDIMTVRRAARGPCYVYKDTQDCKYGDQCRFNHVAA